MKKGKSEPVVSVIMPVGFGLGRVPNHWMHFVTHRSKCEGVTQVYLMEAMKLDASRMR